MRSPRAGGRRCLASAGNIGLPDLADLLRPRFPSHAGRIPRLVLPDWMVRLYALLDADVRANLAALGAPRPVDASHALALLGHPFTAPAESAAATAQSLIARHLV